MKGRPFTAIGLDTIHSGTMDSGPKDTLERLPNEPGVYLFKDRSGSVIYVGKARDLRSRVRSYFLPGRSDYRFFVHLLDRVLGDIETVITGSEKEAALLENNLIKEHQPRYNVRLRDDKDFLHLKIDLDADWPKLQLVRRPKPGQRNVKIFGPYHSARSARRTMLLASRYFKLRTCKDTALRNRKRPCLLYQMKRCPGPCVFDVNREEYLEHVSHAALFLSGRHDELITALGEQMASAASELAFERAAQYRDQLRAIETSLTDQHIVQVSKIDQDVLGLHRDADVIQVVVLQVRGGKITGQREFHWKGLEQLADDGELLSSLATQYYERGIPIPDAVLFPVEVDDAEGLAELLTERRDKKVTVARPKRGHRAALLEMARANAEHRVSQRKRSAEDVVAMLQVIADRLNLSEPPRVIECIDVAHHQSGRAVAAIAVLVDGKPESSRSRSFNIKTAKVGDDYGGMYEVLSRRFRRAKADDEGWKLPDLLVVDGGRGQLSVAEAARRDVGLADGSVPMVGLAKERAAQRSPNDDVVKDALVERVYLPGRVNPLTIRGTSPLLLLCHARDEAHRLAGKLLQRQRKARTLTSPIEEVPGVGPSLRKALLRRLGSLKAVKAASIDDLKSVPGIGPAMAEKIYNHFH